MNQNSLMMLNMTGQPAKRARSLIWLCICALACQLIVAPVPADGQAPHENPVDLQPLIDAAPAGGTVVLNANTIYYGAVIDKAGLTLRLNGARIAPAPGIVVAAVDVTLDCTNGGSFEGDPFHSGQPSLLTGITVAGGADNLIVMGCEIHDWADAVVVQDSVTSFKLVDNYLHHNADAGLQINGGVTLSGVVSIVGNLFKSNEGPGIRHDGTGLLMARYNSWGNLDGATPGDGIGGAGALDVSAPTFAEAFVGVDPDDFTVQQRTVSPDTQFEVAVAIDAANLYGLYFSLTYEPSILVLENIMPGEFVGQGSCLMATPVAGYVSGVCYRQNPDEALNGIGVMVLRLRFLADTPGMSYLDLRTSSGELTAGARGGIGVYLNNGGYGEIAGNLLRQITDENDGEIIVASPTSVNITQFGNESQWSIVSILLVTGMLLLLLSLPAPAWSQMRRLLRLSQHEQENLPCSPAQTGDENSVGIKTRNEEKLS